MKFSLHDLKNVNTVLGMLYDKDGNYRPGFKPEEFYNTILLDSLKYGEENYVHLKYAETVNIRKGEKVARFRRWAGMTPTLRPLMEGLPPAPDKHAYEYMEVGNVFSFGRWSEYTDQIDMSVVSEVVAERSVQYGENANQTKELYARKTWLSSPNEFYANFKDSFADLLFGDAVTIDDLRFLVARMKRMQVKPISGKFNYICSQEFINGLIDDPRVKMYMQINQTTGNLWTSGECFPLFDLNFIPTMLDEFAYPDTEFPGVYEDNSGKEWIRLYAVAKPGKYGADEVVVSDPTVYYLDIREDVQVGSTSADTAKVSFTGYLPDGTAVEEQDKWELPNTFAFAHSGTYTYIKAASQVIGSVKDATYGVVRRAFGKIVSSAFVEDDEATPITIDGDSAITDQAKILNALIADGEFMQLPVHRGILFGDEAMIKLNYEGLSDAPKIIIKALGSAGTLDPLNQRQSVGYRVDGFGLAIKRPEAICITYGIPANAEFAALTSAYMVGHPVTLDNSANLATDVNAFATDASGNSYQKMVVDAVNNPYGIEVNKEAIDGANKYPEFKVSTAYAVGATFQYKGVPYVVHTAIAASSTGSISTASVSAIKEHCAVVHDTLFDNLVDKANDKESNVK